MGKVVGVDAKTGEMIIRDQTQEEIDRDLAILPTEEDLLLEKRKGMVATAFQFRKALTRSGEKRGQVNALVANPNTGDPIKDQDIKDGWESAGNIKRLDPLALYVQEVLGWSGLETDEIFVLADTL